MDLSYPPVPPLAGGHAIRSALSQFPVVCFTLTLLTDLAYWGSSGNILWQNFSAWLLLAGLVGGGLAALVTLVGLIAHRHEPLRRPGWPFVLGGLAVLAFAILNSFVHARDGWTAVVPLGLVLSAVTVVLLIGTAVADRVVVNRRLMRGRP